jgi:hypothetical protein
MLPSADRFPFRKFPSFYPKEGNAENGTEEAVRTQVSREFG